ncbi:MAG: TolC family protein [Candidatus Obscuribacterales bacterium]|nr:TolC family protein [Candidatus Obscuribacterales bacterium]
MRRFTTLLLALSLGTLSPSVLAQSSIGAVKSPAYNSGKKKLAQKYDAPPPDTMVPPVSSNMRPSDPGVLEDLKPIIGDLTPEVQLEDSVIIPPVPFNQIIPIGQNKLPPIKLEASYTEPISLKQALMVALGNNLPIQISKADFDTNYYKYLGSFGGFLPTMSMSYIAQKTSSGPITTSQSPFFIMMIYPVFQGGASLFGMLQARHTQVASKYAYSAQSKDVLLRVAEKYYDLVLNRALLTIRTKAVEVSKFQLKVNEDLKAAGHGTDFEIMQSKTQLAEDKQDLIKQQVAFRKAALRLSVALNSSLLVNLAPIDDRITKTELVDHKLSPQQLTALAIANRPELQQYEHLRLAARRAVQVAAAPLYPRAGFFTANIMNQGVSGGGAGGQSSSSVVIPVGGSVSAGGISESGSGANSTFSRGFILNWLLYGAGVGSLGDMAAARAQARKAMLSANQELQTVIEDVRESFLDSETSESEIEVTSEAVAASGEALRLADLRLRYQLGTNLELIEAQRDYINALSRRVEAFIGYRQSQAKLLHAIGLISVDTLCAEKPSDFKVNFGKYRGRNP